MQFECYYMHHFHCMVVADNNDSFPWWIILIIVLFLILLLLLILLWFWCWRNGYVIYEAQKLGSVYIQYGEMHAGLEW